MTTPSIEQLLHHLIAFPTVSSAPTREIADFICTLAESHDVECVRHAYDDGRKINLLLRAGPAQDSHGLLLCGHLDVVPAAEPEWRSDPFQLIEQDGRLHGRGSADMKGFVALALVGLLAAAKKPLRAPLWLLLTSDEEVGAMGVQQFVNSDLVRRLPRNAIIGEPTQLAAVRMHKGHLKLRITVRGVAAHSGRPLEGVNAIELAGALIRRLAALAAEWREVRNEQSRYFEECPFPVLNLGMIRGGSAVNIVPDECVLDMGIRLLPGQDSAAALRDVQFAISELPLLVREKLNTTVVNENPPLLCPEDALIHRELCRLLAQTDSRGVSFASDAGFLARQGIHCVLWGPGHMADAHRANESIERSQLEQAARLLDRVIERFCIECEENR